MAQTRCVVFAYSEVGSRCLRVLLEAGWEIALVVTHQDDPHEERWFSSVLEIAQLAQLNVITDDDRTPEQLEAMVRSLAPEFIFSFYYRRLLSEPLLQLAARGAFNMHGSLLPKYRGRAPVNWAILHGETETGASLHRMTAKPDAGDLMDCERVAIGENDTALEVAQRVAAAAETTLRRALPGLRDGSLRGTPLDLKAGSYFGGRKPADGAFFPEWSAKRIHDLVRAVAPPFPGAFVALPQGILRVFKTRRLPPSSAAEPSRAAPALFVSEDKVQWRGWDGELLWIAEARLNDHVLTSQNFETLLGTDWVAVTPNG